MVGEGSRVGWGVYYLMSFKAAEGKGREGDKGKGKGQDRPQAVGARSAGGCFG